MEEKEKFIVKEQMLMELEHQLIKDFVMIRKGKMTQQELAEKSEIVRQTINRIENSLTDPQLFTMIKLLVPLGFTLKIVPLEEEDIIWEDM